MMLIITPKLSDLGPRSSCPIGSIAESAYVASIGDDINDVTWLYDVIHVTSQSSKSSRSETRARINHSCRSFKHTLAPSGVTSNIFAVLVDWYHRVVIAPKFRRSRDPGHVHFSTNCKASCPDWPWKHVCQIWSPYSFNRFKAISILTPVWLTGSLLADARAHNPMKTVSPPIDFVHLAEIKITILHID